MHGLHSGILSACKDRMQKSQYQIKKGKTEAGSRWNEECQRLLLSVFAVRIPITDNLPICFGHRYFVWISLMKRLLFSRPLLLLSVLALVFGAQLTCWKVMETTIQVQMLMYGKVSQENYVELTAASAIPNKEIKSPQILRY